MRGSTMRLKLILVLILALIWGVASWRWYTCNIKGFCGVEQILAQHPVSEHVYPDLEVESDLDHDRLTDEQERKLGTDPQSSDSDNDGFSDYKEVGGNLSSPRDTDNDGVIDALDADDDGDRLATSLESLLLTSAYSVDSDNDGLLDRYEVGGDIRNPLDSDGDGIIDAVDYDDDDDGVSTLSEDADPNGDGNPDDAKDSDNDGIADYLDAYTDNDPDNDDLSNEIEAMIGSDPNNSDSDGDGIMDGIEVGNDVNNPLDINKSGVIDVLEAYIDPDPDKDGLTTLIENMIGSNPNNADTDGDGILDAIEVGDVNNPRDLNGNGVIDVLEAYSYTPAKTEYEAPTQVEIVIEQEQRARVHFPFNNAKTPLLSAATEAYFSDLVEKLKAGNKVVLTGHTDNVGDADRNMKLGLARAELIQSLLIKGGAPADQIIIDSKGELEPLQSNKTDLGRGTNRRVELVTSK